MQAIKNNQIIDLVRDKPIIYDKSHPDHFRSNMRTEIWEEIGVQVGLPGNYFHTVSHTDMSIILNFNFES